MVINSRTIIFSLCCFAPLCLAGQTIDTILENTDKLFFKAEVLSDSFRIDEEFELILHYSNLTDDTIFFLSSSPYTYFCYCQYSEPIEPEHLGDFDTIVDGVRWRGSGYGAMNHRCFRIYGSQIYDYDDETPYQRHKKKRDKKNDESTEDYFHEIFLPPKAHQKVSLKLKFYYPLTPGTYEFCILNDHRFILERSENPFPNRKHLVIIDGVLKSNTIHFRIFD